MSERAIPCVQKKINMPWRIKIWETAKEKSSRKWQTLWDSCLHLHSLDYRTCGCSGKGSCICQESREQRHTLYDSLCHSNHSFKNPVHRMDHQPDFRTWPLCIVASCNYRRHPGKQVHDSINRWLTRIHKVKFWHKWTCNPAGNSRIFFVQYEFFLITYTDYSFFML